MRTVRPVSDGTAPRGRVHPALTENSSNRRPGSLRFPPSCTRGRRQEGHRALKEEVELIKNLRITGISAVATLAVVCAPIAQAKKETAAGTTTAVCNLASNAPVHQGTMYATDPETGSPAERFRTERGPMPGNGKGLVNAAGNSPALSVCATTPTPVLTGGGTSGGTGTAGDGTGGTSGETPVGGGDTGGDSGGNPDGMN